MTERLKVLVSAYACSPYKGSEPGVGWGFVAALAKRHELWIIVEEKKFRADIERYLSENPGFAKSVHFYFLRKERNRWLRKLWPPSYYWYYRRWHHEAFELAQHLHREVGFDVAHQLTMVGFREPGYLWKLGIPFVWGPIGGMGLFPWRFLPMLGAHGAIYYLGYNLFNLWQMRVSLRPRLAARAAGAGLLSATPENQQCTEKFWKVPSALLCEVGVPPVSARVHAERKGDEPLRIVWTGLHIPRKALNLALEAVAHLPADVKWELHVLGKGPLTGKWCHLAEELGISTRCKFHGWLSREEALAVMSSSHLMLITSLRDLTSTVTIEALALGLPIVCLDHCGFAGVVDDSCGIKVPVTSPASVVAGLSAAIAQLAGHEKLRAELAKGAVARARDYSWEKKAQVVECVYREKLLDNVESKG